MLDLFELLGPEGLEMISTILQRRAAIVDSFLSFPNERTGYLPEFPQALPGAKVVTVSHLKPVLALFNTEVLAVKSEDTNLTKTSKKPFWAT
ncbi:hypothetical protein ILYODFUR_034058 [Ilyodon furcidens]|uniref:Uncharacterized protein n=1 Tax=Ilyodon furcidens TaxID=33524 RepID=A0ABV0V8G1_9TELE